MWFKRYVGGVGGALAGSALAVTLALGGCSDDPASSPALDSPDVDFHVNRNVCDRYTFGTTTNGIVVSGEAGRNEAGEPFGEIQITLAGGDVLHAHVITNYADPLDGPLSGGNCRLIVARATTGEIIRLRVCDVAEGGAGRDRIRLVIDGEVVLSAQTIDLGNIQFHNQCLPGEGST